MNVLILGSGVIGMTTAWHLARAGANVTVVDRQPGAALETSFANAGQISPGYSTPWAAPGIPLKAMRWLLQRHSPLAIRPDVSSVDHAWFQAQWMMQMLMQCTQTRYAINKERMVRLSEYALVELKRMRQAIDLPYEGRQAGTLQVFRKPAQLQAAQRDIEVLQKAGVAHALLDVDGCVAAEPALAASRDKLVGGLRLPGDETGDCHLFVRALELDCVRLGVKFLYQHEVCGWHLNSVSAQRTSTGKQRLSSVQLKDLREPHGQPIVLDVDQTVVALGSYSRPLLKPLHDALGQSLPVYPMKGYSLTLPLIDAAKAPVSTVMDETYKIAMTRFDNRIRVGGMAELSGYDLSLNPRRRETLAMVVQDMFPGGGDVDQASFWTGLRPMTPDGTPIVGATQVDGLWLNTGHGTLGWTMACGSARILADQMLGRTPEIRVDDYALSRYAASGRQGVSFGGSSLQPATA